MFYLLRLTNTNKILQIPGFTQAVLLEVRIMWENLFHSIIKFTSWSLKFNMYICIHKFIIFYLENAVYFIYLNITIIVKPNYLKLQYVNSLVK